HQLGGSECCRLGHPHRFQRQVTIHLVYIRHCFLRRIPWRAPQSASILMRQGSSATARNWPIRAAALCIAASSVSWVVSTTGTSPDCDFFFNDTATTE